MNAPSGHWRRFDDLAHEIHDCRCVLVDARGRLWAGSRRGGLTRYDGHTITTFTETDGLSGNYVRRVMEDADGGIWAASGQGASVVDLEDRVQTYRADAVRSLLQRADGAVLIGTRAGLLTPDGGNLAPYAPAAALVGQTVSALLEDSSGRLWIGTHDGLHVLHGSTLDTIPAPVADDFHITCLHEDTDGRIWIGTYRHGLYGYNIGMGRHLSVDDGLAHNRVSCLLRDARGVLWIGSAHEGVTCYDGSSMVTLTTRDGLAHNHINDMVIDAEGSMWIACSLGGLSVFTETMVTLSDAPVTGSLTVDPEGRIWWGSEGSLTCLANGVVSQAALDGRVSGIIPSRDGGLCVAAAYNGAYTYRDRAAGP